MRKILNVLIVSVCLFLVSCGAPVKNLVPASFGVVNDARLAVKDYETRGIIFVSSVETIRYGKKTGSNVTYDMLMREAYKLGADDIINLRVDVNTVTQSGTITRTYTATALAIKYTGAVSVGAGEDVVGFNILRNSEVRIRPLERTGGVSAPAQAPAHSAPAVGAPDGTP